MESNALVKKDDASVVALSQSDSLFFNIQKFEHAQRIAKMLATSTMMPEHFRDNIGNCMILLNYADRIGADIFMLAQGMHVVHGKPGLEGKLIIGLINGSGRFEPLEFEEIGNLSKPENDDDGCSAFAKEIRSGKILKGPRVDWRTVKSEGWYDRKDRQGRLCSKWRTMAPLMFRYRAASYFGRVYCPDVLLGMQTREELVDVVEMERAGGRYVQADEPPKQIEKPVYVVHQAAEIRPENERQVEIPKQEKTIGTASNEVEKQEPNHSSAGGGNDPETADGWQTGDIAYYKLGLGIGWKQLRIIGYEGDDAVVEFAEDYEHNGKQMRGQISKKPLADLRDAVPQPLTRDEFINLRSGFTSEYLEQIRERIEETKDAKVIADLILKAKKFFGDDYKVPGLPPAPDETPVEDPEQEPQEAATAGEARIGDDPERKALKRINAMIDERGMDRPGVKKAMRGFVLHVKGEQPIKPFDVDSTTDIQLQHIQYFNDMLDSIQPQHNIMMAIKDRSKQVKGFEDYVKAKMLEFPNPVRADHWYLIPPGAVNRINLNADDWAAELLDAQRGEGGEEKF